MGFSKEMSIHTVLDYINYKFKYDGIDNIGKITKDRDDLITKNAFHNWIRRYNEKVQQKNEGVQQYNKRAKKNNERLKELENLIQPVKKGERNSDTFYKRKDVDLLINEHRESLKKIYLDKTEEIWTGWNQDERRRVAKTVIQQREANDDYIDYMHQQRTSDLKEKVLEKIIIKFVDEDKLIKDCKSYLNEEIKEINLEDYIRTDLFK